MEHDQVEEENDLNKNQQHVDIVNHQIPSADPTPQITVKAQEMY